MAAVNQQIVDIITGAIQMSPENRRKAIHEAPRNVLEEAILKIIRDALASRKNIKTVLSENVRKNARDALSTSNSIAKLILDIIGNSVTGSLKKETAKKVVTSAGPPPRTVTGLVLEALKRNETAEVARKIEEEVPKAPKPSSNNMANLIYTLIVNAFKNKIPVPPKMYNVSSNPNFLESKKKGPNGNPTFNIEIPGYIFTTGNKGTGYYRNTGKPPGPEFGPAPPPAPPPPRNYSGLNLKDLFNARRKYPNNKDKINSLIRSKIESVIRNLKYLSGAMLFRRATELLRLLPDNYPGRSDIVNLIVDEIRRISRSSNLESARRNLRNVRNRNVRDELNRKARNLRERRGEGERRENEYRQRRNDLERRRRTLGFRREGETNTEYARRKAEYNRNKEEANRQEMILRRTARLRALEPPRVPNVVVGPGRQIEPGPGVPPLPPSQEQAIANAGGVNRTMNTIASVPGGAPEVAKAAEALNETGGNVVQAITIRGASPQAIKAVQNLGGPKNTVYVLEGLNTLSQTPETRRRKAARRTRRPKKSPVRLTELNRVIAAVKKQKLISLMAHNITRTNNIHPNDEKLKKYYKKVVKSYLLKKPFANIVKKAARKNM